MMQNHSGFSAARAYRGEVGDRVARFLPLVRKLAWHLSGSVGGALDVEDLVQAGLVALTECAQRHNSTSDDGFAAYAKLRVRGAMVDLLRKCSPDSRGARSRRQHIEAAETSLRQTLGRDPSLSELAEALGRPAEEVMDLRRDSVRIATESMDECYSDHDIAFAEQEPDAEARLLQGEDRELLAEAIAELPERLQLVIHLYFVEELNLAEIALALNVSVPRVHQLKSSALEKLRVFYATSCD